MSEIRKLAGETAIYGVSTIVTRLLNYLLVPLYVRVFAPGQYGVIVDLYAYITFLNIIYTFGMETSFFHYSNKTGRVKDVLSGTFGFVLVISLILSGMIFFGGERLAILLNYPQDIGWVKTVIYMISGILFLDAIAAIPFAYLRFQKKSIKFVTLKTINVFVNIALNLFFLLLCPYVLEHSTGLLGFISPLAGAVYDPDFGVGYVILSNLAASFINIIILYKEILEVRLKYEWKLIRTMLKYSFPLVFVGLAGMINETLDRPLLKYLLPYSEEKNLELVGIYGACYKLSIFMSLATQAFRYASEPFFFAHAKKGDPKPVYARVLKYYVFTGALIFLFVSLYIDLFDFLVGREGSDYHEGLKVVPVLLMANLFLGSFYTLSIWYKLTEKNRVGAVISVGGALLTIILNVLWIPLWGYMGSAWATLVCYFTMAAASYLIGQKYYPVKYEIGRILFYILMAGGIYFLAIFTADIVPNKLVIYLFNLFLISVFVWVFQKKEKINFILHLQEIIGSFRKRGNK